MRSVAVTMPRLSLFSAKHSRDFEVGENKSSDGEAEGRQMITGEQVKAARKLLGWSQLTLSLEASVATSTVTNFETVGTQRFYDEAHH
jgi:hypothetical protein